MNAATAGLRDCAIPDLPWNATTSSQRSSGRFNSAMPILGNAFAGRARIRKSARHESDAEAARDEIEQHLNITDFKHRLAR